MIKQFIHKIANLFNPPDNPHKQKSVLSTYKEQTGKSFLATMFDKGNYGEYSSYGKLAKLPGYHKALFNLYIPKGKDRTTEIDLVFLHETGVYVVESKNYSGWIFGDDNSQKWMQTFPNGHKQSFYNPIKQNKGHIRALQSILPSIEEALYKSLIVFSERCELKKVSCEAPHTYVLKRDKLKKHMEKQIQASANVMDAAYIDRIYNFLSQYQKVDEAVKREHIERIKGKHG